MKFRVIIEDIAERDIEAIVLWIAQHDELAAHRWYWQLSEAIRSLATSPMRCPLAPEDEHFPEEIRHLCHGRSRHVYRVLFTVRGKCVHVLHVQHGAQEPRRPPSTPQR